MHLVIQLLSLLHLFFCDIDSVFSRCLATHRWPYDANGGSPPTPLVFYLLRLQQVRVSTIVSLFLQKLFCFCTTSHFFPDLPSTFLLFLSRYNQPFSAFFLLRYLHLILSAHPAPLVISNQHLDLGTMMALLIPTLPSGLFSVTDLRIPIQIPLSCQISVWKVQSTFFPIQVPT